MCQVKCYITLYPKFGILFSIHNVSDIQFSNLIITLYTAKAKLMSSLFYRSINRKPEHNKFKRNKKETLEAQSAGA